MKTFLGKYRLQITFLLTISFVLFSFSSTFGAAQTTPRKAVVDFNGDSKTDLIAVSDYGLSVMLGSPSNATASTTSLTAGAASVVAGQPVSLTATVAPAGATGTVTVDPAMTGRLEVVPASPPIVRVLPH